MNTEQQFVRLFLLQAVGSEAANTQSERDWAYAIRHLRHGDNPEHIVREIAAYRATDRYDSRDTRKLTSLRKANPRYYAEHTVSRAMAQLGMTRTSGAERNQIARNRTRTLGKGPFVRTAGYMLRLLARWAIITLWMSLLLSVAAGTTRLPSLRNYLVTFSAFLLATMLVIDPGLVEERSRTSEERGTSDRFAASLTFLATLVLAALDVGRLHWFTADFFEGAPGQPAPRRSRKHPANVGNGRQSVLLARYSAATGARTPAYHPRALSPSAAPGLSSHADFRSSQRVGHRFLAGLGPCRRYFAS